MLKKAFLRLIILGVIAFASFFALISAEKVRGTVNSDCTEANISNENPHQAGDFILETFISSILTGTH